MSSSPTALIEPAAIASAGDRMASRLRRLALALVLPMLISVGFGVLRGGGGYVTDFPPPNGRETYAEVMPARIAGFDAQITALPVDGGRYRGARARYGDLAKVDIVQTDTPGDLDAYVADYIRPRLAAYDRRVDGKVDGLWRLQGSGEGRLYAWQNGRWLFLIEARSNAAFDEVVHQFAFIRRG